MKKESSPNSSATGNNRSNDNSDGVITIKKYANRRLYNTATSCYVTLDHLSQMVKDGQDFVVFDAKSGEDITRSVLTQIIVEEENKGQNLLPISFLRQLIAFYGDSMQWMVPKYLEHSMESFAHNQDQMRQMMKDTLGGMFPFGNLEEVGKQNMAMFEKAMSMFSPFPKGEGHDSEGQAEASASPRNSGSVAQQAEKHQQTIDTLTGQLQSLQQQLSILTELQKKAPDPDKQ